MRVAIDVSGALHEPTGVGRYTSSLAGALERHVEVVRFGVSWRAPRAPGVRRWKLPAHYVQRSWMRLGLPSPVGLYDGADVVHGANFVLPPLRGRPGVVTIHDLWFLKDEAPPVAHLRDLVPWTLQRASAVITPTKATADEVCDVYGVARERVFVTHLGVDDVFAGAAPFDAARLATLGLTGPFALAVGTIQPRKNLHRLLSAWQRAEIEGWTLALVGRHGWGEHLPHVPGVVQIGYAGDDVLPSLMASAGFFCYPSLEEGFGLPPLEAMATGTPVLAGAYPAAEEVLGDAALIVDPYDVDAIVDGLRRMAGDDAFRASMARTGREHARRFTWDRTAQETLACYRAVLA